MKMFGMTSLIALVSLSSFAQGANTKGAVLNTQTPFLKCLIGLSQPALSAAGVEYLSASTGSISVDKRAASMLLIVQNQSTNAYSQLALVLSTTDPRGWEYNQNNEEIGFIARSNVQTDVRLVSVDSTSGAFTDVGLIDASGCFK